MLELDDIADVVATAVREATAPLLVRIANLEKRELLLPEKGDPGEQGEPGEVDMAAVSALIAGAVEEAAAREIAKAVQALPAPEKGEPGRDADMAEVGVMIESAVASAVKALPPPKDGEPGKDGVGLADALKDAEGNLVLVMTDGRTKSLGRVDGRNGNDGANGRDGVTPTFIDAEFIGRTLRLSFDGDRACEFKLATPEYAGVFKEGQSYEPGDMVTWGGSLWHCDKETTDKPGSENWSLAVKKGRDAK